MTRAFGWRRYDSFESEVMGDKNVLQFSDELTLEDPWDECPDNCT